VDKSLRASYLVSLQIAKNKKPHNIGENLIVPAVKDIIRVMFGEEHVKKVESIPLSNNTVKRRIDEMSNNVENQLIKRIKESPKYCLQIDETTDITKCAQLLSYVRYIYDNEMREELLFCHQLETNTIGEEIFKVLDNYISQNLSWAQCKAICSDGAASMTGKKVDL